MAKAKNRELTIKEKLSQALITVEEQPHEIPNNWVWTKLGCAIEIVMGQSPNGEDTTDDDSFTGLIGGASDMGEVYPNIRRYTVKPTKLSTNKDVILSVRATLGRPIFSDGKYCLGRGVCALRSDIISNKFVRFFIENYEDYLYQVATGSTFAQVSRANLEDMFFPLPPIAEQQRIVDRLESLFSKLDQAKELAQNALDSFENRKSAILHKAFNGELTANWRKENSVGIDSWKEITLGKLLKPMETKKPLKDQVSFKYIDIDAIDNSVQSVREIKNILVLKAPSRASRGVETGDVLFSLVRPYLKNIAYIDEGLSDCIVSTGFYVCKCKSQLHPFFLYQLLRSQTTIDYYTRFMKGDNSPSIRKTDFEGLLVSLPTLPEQQEIVRLLDILLEKEQKAQELSDVVDKIEVMKKAILARAFRGELGTNDPNDVNAIELLKECLQ